MTTFDELDEHLGLVVPKDYWSDEGIVRAIDLAGGLDPEGWADLAKTWRDRPPTWQIRCAEMLSDVAPAHSIAVLGEMIASPADPVALRAADSLRSILEANPTIALPSVVLARAEGLVERAGGVYVRSVEQLIGVLRNRR